MKVHEIIDLLTKEYDLNETIAFAYWDKQYIQEIITEQIIEIKG